MDTDIPEAYKRYRLGWSIMHISLVAALFFSVGSWYFHDNQGSRAVGNVVAMLERFQEGVAGILLFPWERSK